MIANEGSVANKADRTMGPIYRVFCPKAGQSMTRGFTDLMAISAAEAARIHAERMTHRDWSAAKYGTRSKDPRVDIYVWDAEAGADGVTERFVVRRRMEPVFEVIK